MWYVYFLELKNGDIYVGSTDDLKRRFKSHNYGGVEATKPFLPAKLKSYVAVEMELNARQLERYFKSGSGKAFAYKRFCLKHEDLGVPVAAAHPSPKPHNVWRAELVLWGWTAWIVLFGIYQTWRQIPEIEDAIAGQLQGAFSMAPGMMMEIAIASYAVLGALSAWVVWKIGAGKHWARASLLWGFVLQAGWALVPPYNGFLDYVADVPDYALQAWALYLLYTPPARGWFIKKA